MPRYKKSPGHHKTIKNVHQSKPSYQKNSHVEETMGPIETMNEHRIGTKYRNNIGYGSKVEEEDDMISDDIDECTSIAECER